MPQAATWFHAHQDTISRRSGRTATGIASYVTGQRIKDDETGKWLKRNHPGDVLAFGTVAPEGAPDFLTDNSQLARAWNEAQKADGRKNAQLARHWNIALSRDLTKEQQIDVMKAIAQAFTDRYGTMTTWAVHSPTDHGDDRNAHGHIVHNMRMVTPAGFGPKVLEPVVFKTAKREMEWARSMIAGTINAGLERAGLDERVAHLSYEAQGIDREAKRHLGNKQNQAELKGENTPTGDYNRAVDERNKEREAEANARQAEQAQLSAEIIDLEDERRRRNQGMEPPQATDETARKQLDRQQEWYRQAEQVHKDQQKEHDPQRLIDDAKRQAEEAERDKGKRQKDDQARREADAPTDARSRYAQALGENYDIRDPFGSLAKAAMSEYRMFTKQQQQLKERAAAEHDPEKKRMIEMRRQVELHDYMAITHERLAGITRSITRSDNEIAQRDDREASRHRAASMELRAVRDGRTLDDEKQRQQQPAAQRQEAQLSEPADWNAKTGRWNEGATGSAPIRNAQHTGNVGQTISQQEKEASTKAYLIATGRLTPEADPGQKPQAKERDIAGARQVNDEAKPREQSAGQEEKNAASRAYLIATGRMKPEATPRQEPKAKEQETIVTRQAEETKQRAGLQNDQPMETAKGTTREAREIAAKDEARAVIRNGSESTPREKGRDGSRPTGRGGRGR